MNSFKWFIVDSISKLEAITFAYLNEQHLLRSLPAVITDSHHQWKNASYKNLTSFVERIEPLLLARPCNVQTNLIFDVNSPKKYENTMTDLYDMLLNVRGNDSWFLHFRNCELNTVKQTRLLIGKPYFYPAHLEMPYTTWIMMSNNYRKASPKTLNLDGLTIVMQVTGVIGITLQAKEPCDRTCGSLTADIREGESLIFSTKLWRMKYLPAYSNETSISFVTETYQS